MKPKDFIEKYKLTKGWNYKCQDAFLQDLTSELLALLEYYKAHNNIKGFDNAIRVIRAKWDSVSKKIPYGLPEKMWSYFWAKVVVDLREMFCPEEMERRRNEAQRRREERENREEWKRYQEEMFYRMYEQVFYERLALYYLLINEAPLESFAFMGLNSNSSEDEVKAKYRDLALSFHPDRGGNMEDFVKLTEHKNKCLKWISLNKKS